MEAPSISRYEGEVTLIAYTFPKDENDFDFIEFAIRQSWHCLGKLKAVIIADRMTERLDAFAKANPEVEIQLEPSLKVGDILTMTDDCIERLHTRFSTPYCLIVQDDGFPLRNRLSEFLGKYDYLGSPSTREGWVRDIAHRVLQIIMNGGFSLRSRKICKAVSQEWKFWKHVIKRSSRYYSEDYIYSSLCRRNPLFALRFRFPSAKVAREFCLPDFTGVVDIRNSPIKPLGVHGTTACLQLLGI